MSMSTSPEISPTTASATPSSEADLVGAANDLVPLLSEDADEAIRLARPTDRVIAAIEEAGLLRLAAPSSRGGHQVSLRTFVAVHEALARGCGSTSWVAAVYNGGTYMTSSFCDEAQDEFYATASPKTVAAFNPAGQATPDDGGYKLSGTWRFCSGQHHADWALLSSFIVAGADSVEPAQFLVRRDELVALDDWQVSGLAGTGSNTLTASGVFVPSHRVTPLSVNASGATLSESLSGDPYFKMPFIPFFVAGAAGTPLGLAESAVELLRGRVHKRAITYTHYDKQNEAPITHFQMDAAVMKVAQARFHAEHAADALLRVAKDLEDIETRVRIRSDVAWTTRLCREAVETVQQASGASAIHARDPLRRIFADIEALSVHSFLLHNTNAELHGRVLCGMPPEVPFI